MRVADFDICKDFDTDIDSADIVAVVAVVDEMRPEMLDLLH